MTIQSTTPRTFDIPTGLRNSNTGTILWLRSPKTGTTITVSGNKFNFLPNRLLSRVASAVAVGRHSIAMTRDELLAVVSLQPAKPVERVARLGDKFPRTRTHFIRR